jgi:uncharacterized repeat protein (TIGR01451 family)
MGRRLFILAAIALAGLFGVGLSVAQQPSPSPANAPAPAPQTPAAAPAAATPKGPAVAPAKGPAAPAKAKPKSLAPPVEPEAPADDGLLNVPLPPSIPRGTGEAPEPIPNPTAEELKAMASGLPAATPAAAPQPLQRPRSGTPAPSAPSAEPGPSDEPPALPPPGDVPPVPRVQAARATALGAPNTPEEPAANPPPPPVPAAGPEPGPPPQEPLGAPLPPPNELDQRSLGNGSGGTPVFPPLGNGDAPRDDQALRVQAPSLAPSARSPAADPGVPAGAEASVESPFLIAPEKLALGKHTMGLTVEVVAPAVVNLHQETKLKVIVRNGGSADAQNVLVRDQLPEGLAFIDSQPPTQPTGQLLVWKLGTLAANSERVLVVRVRPTQVGSFDHTATVVAMSGGKSRTLVQEPKLKVEQTVKRSKVLKGGQVEFDIAVSNPGTGPARNVVVQAKLSQGLKHQEGAHVEQLVAVVKPGERIELEPLMVDATEGGEQSSVVTAHSPDVISGSEEDRSAQAKVEVVEPKLAVKLAGPTQRFTDTVAAYKVHVQNPGTAAARLVRVVVTLPLGGVLIPNSSETAYDRQDNVRFKRQIIWNIPQLDPKADVVLPFEVRLGGISLYQVTAEARAQAPLPLADKSAISTDVTGMADVDFQVIERRRVLDVGEETDYEIRVTNHGSKEAHSLLISAELSENLEVTSASSLDDNQLAKMSPNHRDVRFPTIARLAPKGELVLTIRVHATRPGVATCQVFLVHDELENSRLSRTAATRVTAAPTNTRLK